MYCLIIIRNRLIIQTLYMYSKRPRLLPFVIEGLFMHACANEDVCITALLVISVHAASYFTCCHMVVMNII